MPSEGARFSKTNQAVKQRKIDRKRWTSRQKDDYLAPSLQVTAVSNSNEGNSPRMQQINPYTRRTGETFPLRNSPKKLSMKIQQNASIQAEEEGLYVAGLRATPRDNVEQKDGLKESSTSNMPFKKQRVSESPIRPGIASETTMLAFERDRALTAN